MIDIRAKQVIFGAVPFVLDVKPGERLDSWLVHPTMPMAQRKVTTHRSIQTYSIIYERELLEDESYDEAHERIYPNPMPVPVSVSVLLKQRLRRQSRAR